ncbi:MAG TPA: hypothetical protein VNM16_03485 [Bacillota bacterium]|nr:hypothetical protein [Bacillota bacterium]
MRRPFVPIVAAAGLLLVVCSTLGVSGRAASGIQSPSPWWFQDDYTSLSYIDPETTTAEIDPAGTGTISLPLAPAAVAFDPAAAVAVLVAGGGAEGFAFDGARINADHHFDVAGVGYVGAAWIGTAGSQLAVATPNRVALDAWSGTGWTEVGSLAAPGTIGLAEGPPIPGASANILVGTSTGFGALAYRAAGLEPEVGAGVHDLQGVSGIASAPGGALVAVGQGTRVRIYGWDGQRYREVPAWEPASSSSPIQSIAWFRHGDGFWTLANDGALTAFGMNGSVVTRIPQLSAELPTPVSAIGTGWRQGQVAALVPSGWTYYDGATLAQDSARSLTGLRLPLYEESAQAQSIELDLGHTVDQIQIDSTITQLPVGTAIGYQISWDAGKTWTSLPACQNATNPVVQCRSDNTPLPPSIQLSYRVLLSTTNPSETPVVDATALFEIATETTADGTGSATLVK